MFQRNPLTCKGRSGRWKYLKSDLTSILNKSQHENKGPPPTFQIVSPTCRDKRVQRSIKG